MLVNLVKIKTDRDTKEDFVVSLNVQSEEIACLYKDRNGVFLITIQGTMHKLNHDINDLTAYLRL